MIQTYILNYNSKDDISYLMNNSNNDIIFNEQLYKDKDLTIEKLPVMLLKKQNLFMIVGEVFRWIKGK